MRRTKKTYNELLKMAKAYGVADNAMFISAANQYQLQTQIIDEIRKEILKEGSLLSSKEYVKGRENIYMNPLAKELPKHSDSANKTLNMMLQIIATLGTEPAPGSKLSKLLDDDENE